MNLESVFVTLGLPEVLADLAEVEDGDLIAFAEPSVEKVGGAPLGEPEPEDSAPEVVVFLRTRQRFLQRFTSQSGRREKSRKIAGSVQERK